MHSLSLLFLAYVVVVIAVLVGCNSRMLQWRFLIALGFVRRLAAKNESVAIISGFSAMLLLLRLLLGLLKHFV